MEHIEEEYLDEILIEISQITMKLCYFSIATVPAKKILSDVETLTLFKNHQGGGF